GLTDVNIPNSVTKIGEMAFEYCSGLTSIDIPNSVTKIGKFAFDYCKRLADVYCYAENMPSTERIVFNNSDIREATLHVPAASIEQYKTTEPWSDFGTIVAINEAETQASKPASKAWAAIIKAGMKVWAVIIKAGTKAIKVLKK
ncbi:MAG: leucine-rich repeat domain-containing protein, partial [Bacteroidaceae bacterium]|nr:leucine-rich repeat domain-containing protein [Bacteroidaceae bacterium]